MFDNPAALADAYRSQLADRRPRPVSAQEQFQVSGEQVGLASVLRNLMDRLGSGPQPSSVGLPVPGPGVYGGQRVGVPVSPVDAFGLAVRNSWLAPQVAAAQPQMQAPPPRWSSAWGRYVQPRYVPGRGWVYPL